MNEISAGGADNGVGEELLMRVQVLELPIRGHYDLSAKNFFSNLTIRVI
jgi:hypothetical protein